MSSYVLTSRRSEATPRRVARSGHGRLSDLNARIRPNLRPAPLRTRGMSFAVQKRHRGHHNSGALSRAERA
jgi:hypothetical protein